MADEKLISVDDDEDLFSSEDKEEQQVDILHGIAQGLKSKVHSMEKRIETFEKKIEENLSKIQKDFAEKMATLRKEDATNVIKQLGKGQLIFVAEDQDGK